MAQQFSKTDQRRITFLSLLSSAATTESLRDDPDNTAVFESALIWLQRMEDEGFFEAGDTRPTPQRSERSARPASSSRPSNSGSRGRDQRGPFTGQMRDPDGPASEAQARLIAQLTDDYTESDILNDFTKQQASDLIQELKS